MKPSPQERFWAKVDKTGECWEWNAATSANGYGRFSIGGRGQARLAHRVSWTWANGEIPEGLYVCHHCDNRRCVRPAHLFLGTALDNTLDMVAKGRNRNKPAPRGIANYKATYDDATVRAARESYFAGRETVVQIAARLGLAKTAVHWWVWGRSRIEAGGPIRPPRTSQFIEAAS